jgi:hypothetical protein
VHEPRPSSRPDDETKLFKLARFKLAALLND